MVRIQLSQCLVSGRQKKRPEFIFFRLWTTKNSYINWVELQKNTQRYSARLSKAHGLALAWLILIIWVSQDKYNTHDRTASDIKHSSPECATANTLITGKLYGDCAPNKIPVSAITLGIGRRVKNLIPREWRELLLVDKIFAGQEGRHPRWPICMQSMTLRREGRRSQGHTLKYEGQKWTSSRFLLFKMGFWCNVQNMGTAKTEEKLSVLCSHALLLISIS